MPHTQHHEHPVRSARRLRGWTQATLAERANVTRRTVIRAEQGRPVHRSTYTVLALALGCTPGELQPRG